MVWDILIAIGIGLPQLGITWYAVDISVKENRKRNAVIISIVGGVGIFLTVFGTVRNGSAQSALEARLDKIQKNTEQPPKVEVNVPPTTIIQQSVPSRVQPQPLADVPNDLLKIMATEVGESMRAKAMGYGLKEDVIVSTPNLSQQDRELRRKILQSEFASDCAQDVELGNRLRDEMLRRLGRNSQKEFNPIKEGSELGKDSLSLRTAATYLQDLSRKLSQ